MELFLNNALQPNPILMQEPFGADVDHDAAWNYRFHLNCSFHGVFLYIYSLKTKIVTLFFERMHVITF